MSFVRILPATLMLVVGISLDVVEAILITSASTNSVEVGFYLEDSPSGSSHCENASAG